MFSLNTLWLFLIIKHFVCDFPLQAFPYMYKNKGDYGHPGGILHSLIHMIGMFIVVYYVTSTLQFAIVACLIDFAVHYHIDWAKMNISRLYNLKPDNSEWFWILLGVDQLLHYLTYYGIISYLMWSMV